MKTIKISLAVAVIGIITFFVVNSLTSLVEPPPPPPVENDFTKIIDNEISALQKLSVFNFKELKVSFEDVKYDINDYYKDKRLGENQFENNQSKVRLSKNLYAVYVVKFINLSNFFFNKSQWNIQDLTFIGTESNALKNSPFLERGSSIDSNIAQIQQVLKKYNEINNFISSCKGSFSNYDLNVAYPIAIVKQKIAKASSYKNNRLENSQVNNCLSLHSQLNEVNKFLFNAHVKYLNEKIDHYKGIFSEKDPSGEFTFNSLGVYTKEFYIKIKNQINDLDNEIYHISNLDPEYYKLIGKLDKENSNAITFFNNR